METKQNSQLGFTIVGMKKELSNLGKKEMTQDKKQEMKFRGSKEKNRGTKQEMAQEKNKVGKHGGKRRKDTGNEKVRRKNKVRKLGKNLERTEEKVQKGSRRQIRKGMMAKKGKQSTHSGK